ncbi:MAG: phosphatidylglycerophosphatase A [Bryobacteraceae bacterium]
MKHIALVLATWFGCGYFPWGPGTVGSLAGLLLAMGVEFYLGDTRKFLFGVTFILFMPAVWAATRTSEITGKKDPGLVVVDEVLGQWVTLLGVTSFRTISFAAAFVLFRLFDIWKPWPVRQFERLPGGYGIVADDIAAGIYGALILYIGGTLKIY